MRCSMTAVALQSPNAFSRAAEYVLFVVGIRAFELPRQAESQALHIARRRNRLARKEPARALDNRRLATNMFRSWPLYPIVSRDQANSDRRRLMAQSAVRGSYC